jgi:hypothetical protein
MRNILAALTLALFALPVAASAQGFPGMTPEQMAQVQKLRDTAKDSSFKALSADHLTKVQAVITQFNNGSVSIPDAVTQIDAVLTPDEAKAVIAAGQTMRDGMRAMYAAANNGASPPPRPAGPPGGGPPRAPDAGRILLQVSASPDALRAAMQQP